jgi:hypothetical protein
MVYLGCSSEGYPITYFPDGKFGAFVTHNNKTFKIPPFVKEEITLAVAERIIKNRVDWLAKQEALKEACNKHVCESCSA